MKRLPVPVSDHAVIRYLERVAGFDVEAVRDEIRRKVEPAVRAGACALNSEGYRYLIADGVVVTVTPASSAPEPVHVKPAPGRRGRGA